MNWRFQKPYTQLFQIGFIATTKEWRKKSIKNSSLQQFNDIAHNESLFMVTDVIRTLFCFWSINKHRKMSIHFRDFFLFCDVMDIVKINDSRAFYEFPPFCAVKCLPTSYSISSKSCWWAFDRKQDKTLIKFLDRNLFIYYIVQKNVEVVCFFIHFCSLHKLQFIFKSTKFPIQSIRIEWSFREIVEWLV